MTRYFFIHIMRTGGRTFSRQVEHNFPRGSYFPDADHEADLVRANISVGDLLALPAERRASLRLYSGHFPFYVTDELGGGFVMMTILRHPVARTISHLQTRHSVLMQRPSFVERGLSIEDLYAIDGMGNGLLRDFQVRQFALTGDDRLRSIDPLEVDDARFETAIANLARVDVIGLQEQTERFKAEVAERFGWTLPPIDDVHVSPRVEVSESLRARIAEDNATDVRFYEHALELVRARTGD
ncbi:MAG: hypothetical protein JO291_09525 [Acidimicrobiia bacterium]|nr:hypothetical protein [Acidimicrobiia bacterium]